MEIVAKKAILNELTDQWRKEGKRIGFVPTMGALHDGHISLVRTSKKENDYTIVSIFVNPTQFNDKEDLKRYPRTPEKDLALLEANGCDLVFMPETEEMYPEEDKRHFDFGYIEEVMEGSRRPGHFNGVAQIVSKLFQLVRPDQAYFGRKDFQQIAIVKSLVKQLSLPVKIVPCPIIREKDGLAMSSRNTLLDRVNRIRAPYIYHILQNAVVRASVLDVESLKQWVIDEIHLIPGLSVEYFEIVNEADLTPIKSWEEDNVKIGCIAVYAGKIRLIDNILFS